MYSRQFVAQHNVPLLEPIFWNLLDTATKVTDSRKKLHSLYCDWSRVSEEAVNSLFSIRGEIIRSNESANITRLASTKVAIMGSICSIIGVALAVPTSGLSLALTTGGTATTLLAGGISFGAMVTKNVSSNQRCEEARNILSKNITLTEKLEEERATYFGLLKQFKDRLEEFRSEDVLEYLAELPGIADIFSRDLELEDDIWFGLLPSSVAMAAMKPEKEFFFKRIKEYVVALIKLIKSDKFLLQLWEAISIDVKKLEPAYGMMKKLALPCALGSVISVSSSTFLRGDSLNCAVEGMATASRVAEGAANAIFVILGIVDIAKTSADRKNNSVSNETEELLKKAEELKEYRERVVNLMRDTFDWHI